MLSILKTSRSQHIRHIPIFLSRNISITCRGRPIDQEEIYRYTNGRFLINEKDQCDRRYVKFDFDRLCELAASVGETRCRIISVDKMEGGFSKALRMVKEDGTEVIAKIPCLNAGPASLTTASEVAVMKYVKSHTSVPIPEVFAWSSDTSNPVGAEYIIMEKAPGVQLFKVWDTMNDRAKLALIKQLTNFESQLSSIQFPAYGNLYLSDFSDIPHDRRTILPSDIDWSGSYFIGPSSDRSWMVDGTGSINHDINLGPCSSLSSYGAMLAKREIYRIQNIPRRNPSCPHYSSSSEKISLLELAMTAMKSLDAYAPLRQHSQPRLWHTDLHMGNIFVSSQDPSRISSLIDWQSIQIAPSFLQARWPEFVTPPKGYKTGFIKPELPDNYNQMDAEEKEIAKYQWGLANRTKAYEVSNFLNDRVHHDAMNVPRVFRDLFIHCGETWQLGCVPLRACLIDLFESWDDLELPSPCPFSFEKNELRAHEDQFREYTEWKEARDFAKEYLGTDEDGWISPELDFDEMRARNGKLLDLFVEKMKGGRSPEEARRMWPFLEDH